MGVFEASTHGCAAKADSSHSIRGEVGVVESEHKLVSEN